MLYDEDDYLRALMEYSNISEKTWLLEHFEIYKSTLIWPPGYPPIKRCGLLPGTLREKFHTHYRAVLDEYVYDLDNIKKTLRISN